MLSPTSAPLLGYHAEQEGCNELNGVFVLLLHADLPLCSLLFSVPPAMMVTFGPSGLSLFCCGWPWCEQPHSLRGVFAVAPPGGFLLAWNYSGHIYSHMFPLQSPSVSLSNHAFLCLLLLLADSSCVLQQEYSVLLRPVESLVVLEFGIFPIASFSHGIVSHLSLRKHD